MKDFAATDRRTLMVHALMLLGAGTVASARHTMAMAAPIAPIGAQSPLSAIQRATLAAAAERIIPPTDTPGALQARVPERLEAMLESWASAQTLTDFRRVLDDIDALPGGGRSFAAMPAEEQHALLAAHDARMLQPQDPGVQPPLPRDPAYARLKDLVITLYFMSQEALSSELPYVHVPGRWVPSIPITPDTRFHAELSYFF